MRPLVTLHVCAGSAFVRMKNVQPEKSLPLNSSTAFDFCAKEISANARINNAERNIFEVAFMRRKWRDGNGKSSLRNQFLRTLENGLHRNGRETFHQIFPRAIRFHARFARQLDL